MANLIEELRDKAFNLSADPVLDRSGGSPREKLERVLAAAKDFRSNLWCKGESAVEALDTAIREAELES
jgi:hypothetical protein